MLPKVGSCFFWLLKSLLDYSSILAPVEIHCIFEYVADDGNLGETLWYFRSRLLIGINICKEVVICYINRWGDLIPACLIGCRPFFGLTLALCIGMCESENVDVDFPPVLLLHLQHNSQAIMGIKCKLPKLLARQVANHHHHQRDRFDWSRTETLCYRAIVTHRSNLVV